MRDQATAVLDRVDELNVGQGMLEAYLYGRGDLGSGELGGALEYGHRLSPAWSAMLRGSLGYGWGVAPGLSWSALAGLRGTFR